jgi:hypothetical protein
MARANDERVICIYPSQDRDEREVCYMVACGWRVRDAVMVHEHRPGLAHRFAIRRRSSGSQAVYRVVYVRSALR